MNSRQMHAKCKKKKRERMKYCLTIYLSSLSGHFVKRYRKIKQRSSEYLSAKPDFMGELANIVQKRKGKHTTKCTLIQLDETKE